MQWRIKKTTEYGGKPLYSLHKIHDDGHKELVLDEVTMDFLEGFSLGMSIEEVEECEGEDIRNLRKEVYRVYQEIT